MRRSSPTCDHGGWSAGRSRYRRARTLCSIRVDSIHRAAGRGRHRALPRQRRRLLRQRAGRDDQRPVEDRADPPARVKESRSARTGNAGLGERVQPQRLPGLIGNTPPTHQNRVALVSATSRAGAGSVTQTKQPPEFRGGSLQRLAIHLPAPTNPSTRSINAMVVIEGQKLREDLR